jgi:hypothetical protein
MAVSRRLVCLILITFLSMSLAMAGCLNPSPQADSPIAAPVTVNAGAWKMGQEAVLFVRSDPPQPWQTVDLLLFPPPGEPAIVPSRERGYFGLAGVQLPWLPPEHREI